MNESIDPRMLLQALLKPMDGGLKNVGAPQAGSPDAGSMLDTIMGKGAVANPMKFSTGLEQVEPGANNKIWDEYVGTKKLPIDALIRMMGHR